MSVRAIIAAGLRGAARGRLALAASAAVVAGALGVAAPAASGAAPEAAAGAAAPRPGASYPDDRWLAYAFRPLLRFDSSERWRPLDVDWLLAEPGHLACPTPTTPPPCAPLTGADQLTSAVDHLDLRGDGPPDGAIRPRIYAHVVRDPDPAGRARPRRIAIDYWWFLRHNAFGIASHEGDWEGVTVIVDPFGRGVRNVNFSQHGRSWRYPRAVLRLRGRHVEVYVAAGSHAAYPRPCARRCRQTEGTLPEARHDGRARWVGNTARGCRARCVALLPSRAEATARGHWSAWPGRWGATVSPAAAAPRSPALQARFRNPFRATRVPRSIL